VYTYTYIYVYSYSLLSIIIDDGHVLLPTTLDVAYIGTAWHTHTHQ
jgi:hypothetical protein